MIPRFKPFLGKQELSAAFRHEPDAVEKFETAFAAKFNSRHAISFPYGRAALWAFFEALDIRDAEIVMPAYTCSVVAHAIVLSGNKPRFVDINLDDYNMNLDQVAGAITEHTRAIIATHLFGFPLDVDLLKSIVHGAEQKFGHKIWVVQDCAHSFGADFDGQSVVNQPDLALFGLNISKQITSIFGGMLTTNDDGLAAKLIAWRDANFHEAGPLKTLRRLFYLLAVYPAFFEPVYGLIYFLQFRTPLLNYLTKAYHLDEKIHFPPDSMERMLPVEARVGQVQLSKYDTVIQRRRETARYYREHIHPREGWIMPPDAPGATYSHFVIRVPNRKKVMDTAALQGLQLGELIEYSVPESAVYADYVQSAAFPNSLLCSKTTINLPVYASLTEKDRKRVVEIINNLD